MSGKQPPLPGPLHPRPVTPGLREAQAARRVATEGLLSVIDLGTQVRETVEQVQAHARLNHIGELLLETWGRRP